MKGAEGKTASFFWESCGAFPKIQLFVICLDCAVRNTDYARKNEEFTVAKGIIDNEKFANKTPKLTPVKMAP